MKLKKKKQLFYSISSHEIALPDIRSLIGIATAM